MERARLAVLAAAVCGIAPLFAAELWSGFRLAQTDPVLSVIAPGEQPLSVRSLVGVWAMALALIWFGLAYWQRRMTLWEAALVIVGGAVALARLGNAWLFGLAILAPLVRQLWCVRPRLAIGALGAAGLVIAAVTVVTTRPPALPMGAGQAALGANVTGRVFADWRWANQLQGQFGDRHEVLAARGLGSEPGDFWIDYVRVTQGHERWAEALRNWNVDLVVLDAAGQARPAADIIRASPDWQVTFDADGALVAERRPP